MYRKLFVKLQSILTEQVKNIIMLCIFSSKLGDYTLSVQHGGKLHHFPIKVTEDKKYLIGGYKFKQLSRIVSYYQVYPLLYNEKNEGVLICEPLIPTKNKKPVQAK